MASSGGDGHRHARSQTMPIIRGKNALTNPKLLHMMETGNTHTRIHEMESSGSYLIPILSPDGTPQDGDTLSPTDIEANLSTEVALTVLDVLELFVHHHKVRRPHIVHHQTLHQARFSVVNIHFNVLGVVSTMYIEKF